jgi:hypothetical protein
MKRHVEFEHLELLTTFVEEVGTINNILGSQTLGANEGYDYVGSQKKFQSSSTCNFTFFGGKTPYKKLNDIQQLFQEVLILLVAKGFFPLNTS